MRVLLKSNTIVKPQRILYPVGKKGVKLTCHGCVSNESLLLPFLNAQKPSLLESFLDQHKAHLFESGLNAAPFDLIRSLPNIQIPGREHLLGLEAWVTF